ncbi:BAG domain-containing protein Samui [Anopheles bellator]|uniref:BAG domain-containing protein Samui n=1 Tax=Anopheles bellator TaxID=139047 RepID=UPI0026486EE7|nr:BAG domain-containing protein Samui [Anopheles bellator]XP_058054315.1 BAG domain-containing protein Samui [Anopheles bellator]XP_058054316.1 BAG domain-containing protein Samui [Anopheles bellator]XP_058054317.1 BAG domain-containing protein Samui [Anopheles bellator]
MSQQHTEPSQQPQVRHIPIYVEGRSEPLLNTSPKSQPSSAHPSAQPSSHAHVPHPSGSDSPQMPDDLFKQNSIFDRDRDIPVRSAFNTPFFKREASPGASRTSPFPDMASHMPHMNTNVPRGSSIPRQTPSPPTAAGASQAHHHHSSKQPQQPSSTYHQQFPPQRHPQQQQQATAPPPAHHSEPQQAAQPPMTGYDQPDSRPKPSPPPPVKDDPTSKISKIQQDVTAIFDLVEKFRGSKEGKKDKTYMYLDEMLTQNLLKLDSIDVGDQPQIKSSRKAAIRSINTCIGVLEQKAEAGALEAAGGSSSSITGRNEAITTANGIDPPKGGMNGLEQHAAGKSASNTSISHSSSNSSQQQQQPIDDAKQ